MSKKGKHRNIIKSIFFFYYDGFREMTWGRVLWLIIIIKLFILLFVIRLFFFKPFLDDVSDKGEYVGSQLIQRSR